MRSYSFLPILCCLFSSVGFSAASSTKVVEAIPQLSEGVTYGGPNLSDNAWQIQLGADYILWLVTQEGLETAFSNITTDGASPAIPGMGTAYQPEFKLRSGFKVHADVVLRESENVDLFLQYIWLGRNTNTVTNNTNINLTYPSFFVNPIDSGNGHPITGFVNSTTTSYQLYYNVLDFEIGRYSKLASSNLSFRPFWGIRGTWQKVNWNTVYYGKAEDSQVVGNTARNMYAQQKTNGAGVRGGLNLAWNLFPCHVHLKNIKILGTAALAGIYGQTTVNWKTGEVKSGQFITYQYTQDQIYRITPVFDLSIGLGWDCSFGGDCCDRYNVELHALWDTQSWVNFSRLDLPSFQSSGQNNMTVQGFTVGLSLTF